MFGFGIIFWVVIVWWLVSMFRHGGAGCGMGNHGSEQKEDNAVDILKNRYAKGEIDKDEFERMKNELQ